MLDVSHYPRPNGNQHIQKGFNIIQTPLDQFLNDILSVSHHGPTTQESCNES